MRKILILFVLLAFLLPGAALVYVGWVYREPYAGKAEEFPDIPQLEQTAGDIAERFRKEYIKSDFYTAADRFRYSSHGLLLIMAVPGGAAILVGTVLLLLLRPRRGGKKRPAKKPSTLKLPSQQRAHAGEPQPAAAATAPATGAKTDVASVFAADDLDSLLGSGEEVEVAASVDKSKLFDANQTKSFMIPDSLLGDKFDDQAMFYDVERVVLFTQAEIGEHDLRIITAVLRPEYSTYIREFTDDVKNKVGQQIMKAHMLRLKRAEQGISPDQFVSQDKRMGEAERETICRRFLPKQTSHLSMDVRSLVGKVFTLSEQHKIQQNTLSDAEDWQDISLRTLVSVMQQPIGG